MILMGILGYRKHTGFMCGLTVAQISEFSFILIAMGVNMGHLNESMLSLVTFIGLITIAGSSYFIIYAEKIYRAINHWLRIFERKNLKHKQADIDLHYDVIILGYDHIGIEFIEMLDRLKLKYLIVDFNPAVIDVLNNMNMPCFYGDILEHDVLESIPFSHSRMVISTVSDSHTNNYVLHYLKQKKVTTTLLMFAAEQISAMEYYKNGATYVITPDLLSGDHLINLIGSHGLEAQKFEKEAKKQQLKLSNYLKHRLT
jgi:voltage-gated potassium channel Kch